MKNIIITAFLCLLLAACSDSASNTDSTNSDTSTKTVEIDSTAYYDSLILAENLRIADSLAYADSIQQEVENFSSEEMAVLDKYLKPKSAAFMVELNTLRSQIKTSDDLMAWFARYIEKDRPVELKTAYAEINDFSVFETMSSDFSMLTPKLLGLDLTCEAECTEIAFGFNTKIMDSIANMTEGTTDDAFVDLLIMADGEYTFGTDYGFKEWFRAMCDYGGDALTGDLQIHKFLIAYDQFVINHDVGVASEWLTNMRISALNSLAEYGSYAYTADKVSAELNLVLTDIKLSPEEIATIKARLEALKAPVDNDIYVDCDNANCPYC